MSAKFGDDGHGERLEAVQRGLLSDLTLTFARFTTRGRAAGFARTRDFGSGRGIGEEEALGRLLRGKLLLLDLDLDLDMVGGRLRRSGAIGSREWSIHVGGRGSVENRGRRDGKA